jgi:hypothetical protein
MVNALLVPFLAIALVQLVRVLFSSPARKRKLSARGAILRRRWRAAGTLVLAAGLIAGTLIYRQTGPLDEDERNAIGYEVGPGYSYPITAGSTKHYEVQMEQIGGKGNVVAAEFRQWCAGLWHGRNLAYTLAVLGLAGGLICFYLARLLPE